MPLVIVLRSSLQVISNNFHPGAIYRATHTCMYSGENVARVPRMETYRSAVIEALTRSSEACSVQQKQMSIYNE